MLSSKKIVMVFLCVTVRVSDGTAPQCHRCPAGKFKSPEMVFSRCTVCPENTFSSSPGAGRCSPCTSGMISRENSAACFCPNGTLLVDSTCTEIFSQGVKLSGFLEKSSNYSIEALTQQLIPVIASLYNLSESLVVPELPKSTGKTDIYLLATDEAQHANNVIQTTAVTPPMMRDVEQTIVPISLIEGVMLACGRNETSIGTACVCTAGYTRARGQCVACAAGKVKAGIGDMACDACTNNTFTTAAAVECASCPVSSVANQNSTSCVCHTGFIFFNSTCTALASVYVQISGVVNVTRGALTTSELEALLLTGISAFFNLPQEFIIMIDMQKMTSVTSTTPTPTSTTAPARTTTTAPARTTTTPMPHNTSNSTRAGRRLLSLPTQSIPFTSVVQAVTASQVQQVQSRLNALANLSTLLRQITRFNVSIAGVQSVEGFVYSNGSPFLCEDDFSPTQNLKTFLLDCILIPKAAQSGAVVAGVLVALVLVLCGGGYLAMKKGACASAYESVPTETVPAEKEPLSNNLRLDAFYRTATLQFPATVAIEYHLVPGQAL